MKSLLLILAFAAAMSSALACSCITPPPAVTRAESSSAVFVGRAVSEVLRGDTRIYTFEATEVLKGDLPKKFTLSTHRDGATCGSRFSPDKEYLVFCSRNAPGELSTGLCAANRDIATKTGKEEVDELRKARNVKRE